MQLLIADDVPTNRRLLRAQLEGEGYTVLEAADGVEALAVLEREPVDAVVSDVLMPRMDGYRLCQAIRQHPEFRALPIILYTSTYDSISDRNLASTVGADRYIIKPAPAAVLLGALQEVMAGAGARAPALPLPDEARVLEQYSQVLVRKLERRNLDLQEALTRLSLAHEEIRGLNRSLERRVEERTRELAHINEELESFSYSISHDLRTPLRHVEGYVERLKLTVNGQLSGEALRYLDTITAATTEMRQLIDDLLAFSRVGRTPLAISRVRLDDVVQQAIRGLEVARGRRIAWQVAPLPPVAGDPALLRQVLINLIGNALKYTARRDPAHVEIGSAGEEDGRMIFFVRDNGAGFDMQYAHKLFGVFQRLHRADDFEGTGIGLAIVRRIVVRHGGRVWADGAVDRGATFYFTLEPSGNSAAAEALPGGGQDMPGHV